LDIKNFYDLYYINLWANVPDFLKTRFFIFITLLADILLSPENERSYAFGFSFV